MINCRRAVVSLVLMGIALSISSGRSRGAEVANPSTVLAPFVNADTMVAVYVDGSQVKVAENMSAALQLLHTLPGEAPSWSLGAMMIDGLLNRFQQAGGQGIYLVGGLEDIHIGGGPIAIATSRPGESPEKLEQLCRDLIRELGPATAQVTKDPRMEMDAMRRGDVVLVGTKSNVARYSALKSSPRANLIDPLAKLTADGAMVAVVFCPGPEYRRVTRELWPQLPGALAPLRGELADRWLHLEAAINPPPNARPRFALQAKDAESAEVFAKLWRDLPIAVTQWGGNEQSLKDAQGAAQLLVDTMPAKVEGNRVSIMLPADKEQITKLRDMFMESAKKSMQVNSTKQRMDQFKHLALALHLYNDKNHRLPASAAIRGKDGQPLLSWRVAILPFTDDAGLALYKEFHLDEPWNSPHNSELIGRMPEIFADPDANAGELTKQGKTTYQVPVGPQTMFFNNEGTKFSEITDGTAGTLAIVEVEPSKAVEWTKPADWEADLEHPTAGLKRNDRHHMSAAYADGHVEVVDLNKVGDKRLRANLTRAGGDKAE